MKLKNIVLTIIVSLFIFKINVYAASGNLSVSSDSVYVNDRFEVSVNINSVAAWNIHVQASGPVSECTINQADATADAMDISKSFNVFCVATAPGTITLNLSGDVTSAIDGNAVTLSSAKTINVSEKQQNNNSENTQQDSNNTQNNNEVTNISNNNEQKKSDNNNLANIYVEGFELIQEQDTKYTLTISHNIESLNIVAIPEDEKATITGTGKYLLKDGENNFQIVITSESGNKKIINVIINRKKYFYLEDIDYVLTENDINIYIDSDTIIDSDILTKVKNSKKIVNFNYYQDNEIIYSWIIDGSKLNSIEDILSTVSFDMQIPEDVLKTIGYENGMPFNIQQKNNKDNGIKLKINLKGKCIECKLYSYNQDNKKLNLLNDELTIDDGYLTFEITDSNKYLLSYQKIAPINNDNNIILLFIIVVIIILSIIIIIFITKNRKKSPVLFQSENQITNIDEV